MTRIVCVKPREGFRLNVRFNDGLEGMYAVEPRRRGGVFLKLLEPKFFNAVSINPDFGCAEWPGDIDLCLDTMHQELTGAAAELHTPMALREGDEKKS